jgi:hypothetical protein
VFRGPLQYQRQRTPGKRPAENAEVAQVDQCFVLCIERVKMRRWVISREHLNDHSIEMLIVGMEIYNARNPVKSDDVFCIIVAIEPTGRLRSIVIVPRITLLRWSDTLSAD